MKKIVGKICKYICATLCVVALACFAGLTNLDKSRGSSIQSALVSVNEVTNKYMVVGGKVYMCPEEPDTNSAEDETRNSVVASTMDNPVETLQGISIYNSDLEIVFLKDGITDYNQAVRSLKTATTATQLTEDIASIVTATRTADSVEISIEDEKQTALVSTSLDAVYSLNALALNVNSSLEYDNGNFMVATQQASVSLLADTTSVFSQKSALVMRLSEGNVTIKGRDEDNIITYAPSSSSLGMGRAFYQTGGKLTIGENVVLQDFSATSTDLAGSYNGGAIYVSSSSSTLTLNCTITNCAATYAGGAIYSNGAIVINGGSYSNNESLNSYGGFIYSYQNYDDGGVVTLNDGIISNNISNGNGGAIYSINVFGNKTNIVNLNGGTIENNKAEDSANGGTIENNKAEDSANGGGGVYGSIININGTIIKGNSTSGQGEGGGVYGSTVNFTSGTISNNYAAAVGGGICATTCTVAKGATITGNSSGIYGGGICATTLNFTGSATISNNSADFGGGGIYIPSGGSYTSSGEVIVGNKTSDGSGGGILYDSTNALSLYATIIGNYSECNGGGICASEASSITLKGGSQIYNNEAYYGGGVYCGCIISYDNGSSTIGIFNNDFLAGGRGGDIYFNDASAYLNLIAGKSYGDGVIVSVYKKGLTSCNIDTAVTISSKIVQGTSGTADAYNFKKYLVVENFDISGEATYECRVNYILYSKRTSTYLLYAEPDDCLLGIVPGYGSGTGETTNVASDEYVKGTVYATNVRRPWSYYDIDDPSTINSPINYISSTFRFTNNFTVNLWADMDTYGYGWDTFTTDMVLASNGGSQGWRIGANSSGYIQARFYDSSSSSYKYATISIKYTSLTGRQMFSITVDSNNLATLIWQGRSSDTTDTYRRATVQLSGPISYQVVVGPGVSNMVIGGQSYISGSSLSVQSGSYFKGAIQAFQISDQVLSVNNLKTIYLQGIDQAAAIYVKGKSGDTYSLATSMSGSSASNSFKGWRSYMPDGQTEPPGSLNEYTFTFGETKYNIISYVIGEWGTGDYIVVLDSNNGSGEVVRQKISYNTSTALTKNTFTRTGYTFLGWSKSANAASKTYSDGESVTNLTSVSQVTLYAVWNPNTICITLSHADADNAKKIANKVYYRFEWKFISGYYTDSLMDDDYDVTDGLETLPTKAGYDFMGYYSDENGKGTRWINDKGKFLDGLYNEISSDTTLHAWFSPIVIQISLWKNDGSVTNTRTIVYCQYGIPKYYATSSLTNQYSKIKPSRAGYDFLGYYADTNGSTTVIPEQYIDAYGNIKETLCTATTGSEFHIYAHWTGKTYEVKIIVKQPSNNSAASFNNICVLHTREIGGSDYHGPMATLNVTHGSTISTSGNVLSVGNYEVAAEIQSNLVPDGYTVAFGTWSNTAGTITADRTIYAYYNATLITYTLKFTYLNNNNTKLFDGEDSSIRLELTENKESDSSLRWYYLIEYTIEDEIFLPYAEKEYYTVNGWYISSASDGDWEVGSYECGDNFEGYWGNAIFSLSTTANAIKINFICDPDGKGRENDIYEKYPVLKNKTIRVSYNGTLKSNAFYYNDNGTTKTYLNWTDVPWVGGIDGWYKNANYTGSAIKVTTQCNYGYFEKPASGAEEFTLYCKWKPITIVFYGETPLGQGSNDSKDTSALATIKLANPVTSATSGYTFKGWYTSQTFADSSYVGGALEDFKVTYIYTPVRLYACWEANEYTITWDASSQTSGLLQAKYWNYANGNYTSSSDSSNRTSNYETTANNFIIKSSVTYGSTGLGYCAPTPIRAGYSFLHWADAYGNDILQSDHNTFKSNTGYGIPSPINEDGVWDLTGNITLHAVWSANTYSITVDTNGGTYSGTASTSYSASNSATINIPSRAGYTFKGWNVSASLKRSTQATINLSYGYLEYSSSYPNAVFYEPFYMASGITYSATKRSASGSDEQIRWREFNTSGSYYKGDRTTSETLVGQGKYVMLWYHNGNTNSTENVSFTTSAEAFSTSTYKSTGNLTLTAMWDINEYEIKYELAGGTAGKNAPTSANYGKTFTVSNPSRTGYVFAGWTITGMDSKLHKYGTSSSLNSSTNASSLSGITATYFYNLRETSGTVTFTAVWLVKNIEITVTTGGGTIGYYINGSYHDATSHTIYGVPGKNSLYARDSRAVSMNEPKYYDGESKYYSDTIINTTNRAYATTVGFVTSRAGYTYKGLYCGSTLVVGASGAVQTNVTISGYKITDANGCWKVWSNTSAAASITLTADWTTNTYTVEFEQSSLSSAPTVGNYTSKEGDYEYKITYGKTFTVSNPSRTGYEFAGWYITNNGGTKVVQDCTTETSFKNLTSKSGDEVTFKALWKTKYINLSINENAGSLSFSHSLDSLFVCYNDSFIYYIPTEYQNSAYHHSNGENTYVDLNGFIATMPADSITSVSIISASRTGYTFKGLSNIFDENLNANKANLNSAISSAQSSGTLSVKAMWTANTYTVKFDNVYAYGTSALEVSGLTTTNEKYKYTATYDTAFTVNNPTRQTYTFIGWKITGMDNTKHYYGASLSTTSTTINSTTMTSFKNLTSINNATVTFTANWEAKTYTIELNANGGTCSVDSINVKYGETYGSLPTPTKIGYTFDGWYTKLDSGTLVEATDKHLQSSMTCLHAHWTTSKYTINYELHLYSSHASGLTLQYYSLSNDKTSTYDVQDSNTRTGKISEFTVEDKLTITAKNVSYDTNSSKYYGIIVYTKNPDNKYMQYFGQKYNNSQSATQTTLRIDIDAVSLIQKLKETGENSLFIKTFYSNGGNNESEYVTASGYKYVHKVTLSDGNAVESGGFLAEANIYEDSANTSLNRVSFSANEFIYKDSYGNTKTITANDTYTVNDIEYKFTNWYYYDTSQNKNVEVEDNTEIKITSDRSFGARYVAYGKTINYECYYDYETCTDVYLVINGTEYRGKGSVYVTLDYTIEILATDVKAINEESNGIWCSYPFTSYFSTENGGYYYSTSYVGGSNENIKKKFVDLSTLFTRSDDTLILRSRKFVGGTTTYGNVPTTYVMKYTLYHPWESYDKENMTFIAENNVQYKLYARYSVLNSDMTSTTSKETLINTATTALTERTGKFAYGEGMEFISEFVNLAFKSDELSNMGNILALCVMTYYQGEVKSKLLRLYSKYGLGDWVTSDNCTCGKGHTLYTMRILIGDLTSTIGERYKEGDIDISFQWSIWSG